MSDGESGGVGMMQIGSTRVQLHVPRMAKHLGALAAISVGAYPIGELMHTLFPAVTGGDYSGLVGIADSVGTGILALFIAFFVGVTVLLFLMYLLETLGWLTIESVDGGESA